LYLPHVNVLSGTTKLLSGNIRSMKKLLSTRGFAARMGISYKTAWRWLAKGNVPGAVLKESLERGSWWEIPESAIDKVVRPTMGPKPGEKAKRSRKSGS